MTTKKKPAKRRKARKHNPSHAPKHHAAPARRRKHNPAAPARRRHKRRKNPGGMFQDLLVGVGVGVLGKIATDVGVSKLLGSQSDYVKGAVKVAIGVGGAILLRKHPPAAFGLGIGVAAPAVVAIVKPMLPAQLSSLEEDYAPALEALRRGERRLGMGAIIGAEELAAIDSAY